MSAVLENLTKGLQEAGKKNFGVEDSSEAMANLAKPIAEAIQEGVIAGNVGIFFSNDEIVFNTKAVE